MLSEEARKLATEFFQYAVNGGYQTIGALNYHLQKVGPWADEIMNDGTDDDGFFDEVEERGDRIYEMYSIFESILDEEGVNVNDNSQANIDALVARFGHIFEDWCHTSMDSYYAMLQGNWRDEESFYYFFINNYM